MTVPGFQLRVLRYRTWASHTPSSKDKPNPKSKNPLNPEISNNIPKLLKTHLICSRRSSRRSAWLHHHRHRRHACITATKLHNFNAKTRRNTHTHGSPVSAGSRWLLFVPSSHLSQVFSSMISYFFKSTLKDIFTSLMMAMILILTRKNLRVSGLLPLLKNSSLLY